MLLSLATSIFAVAMHASPASAANEDVKLRITPSSVIKNPIDVNSFFDVYVEIADVTALFGFDINVTWTDNTLITLDYATSNATTKTLLDQIWGTGKWFIAKSESGGGGGGGYFRIAAVATKDSFNGTHNLMNLHFQIMRSGNFPLQTTIAIESYKLSDSQWTPIIATTSTGLFTINATTPDLDLVLVDPDPTKKFEFCKIFEVEVYATHVTHLTDYNITILFTEELLRFVDIDYWGPFGTGTVTQPAPGSVQVSHVPATPVTDDQVLLFALTFHIEFDDRIEHIWRVGQPQVLTAHVSIKTDVGELSFTEGTIPITGIQLVHTPLDIPVNLIRGDVGPVDGTVTIFDLRTVAVYYDQSTPVKYDLTNDGTIDIFDLVVVATNIGYSGP